MDYWGWAFLETTVSGWAAVLLGMVLGAFLYAAGYREGRRSLVPIKVESWRDEGGGL